MSNNPLSISQDTNNNDIETSTNRTTINGDSSYRESDTNTINEESQTATLGNINISTLELSDIVIRACSNCGEPAQYLCIACGQSGPRYCSSKCQSEDWTKGHSITCSKVTRASQLSNGEGGDERINAVRTSNNKVYGRGNIAQFINKRKTYVQRGNPTSPSSATGPSFTNEIPLPTNQFDLFDEDQVDEFKYYMQQVYKIIKPVVLCILLSVLWVKISILAPNLQPQQPTQQIIDSSENAPESTQIFNNFLKAAFIIGNIIVVTILIVILFKYGFIKILIGFFMVVVLSLLGFMGYLLLMTILQVFQIPMDYATLSFALWNFAAVGLISVFWKGPLLLQQTYLTIMSSLMAFSLTNLPSLTTWILLALLAIWDLIAVLCPFGPLRILVESSRNEEREIPALLYSVNAVWLMASPGLSNQFTSSSFNSLRQSLSSASSFQATSGEEIPLSENIRYNRGEGGEGEVDENLSQIPRRQSSSLSRQQPQSQLANDDSIDDEEVERSGLKLGLGDFVFYSVLVAQAGKRYYF
ncbi:Presenilin-domain-containing protein [Glomus cerebriforme]|uniref:Presenilin n=1 Tax=Glomus cerebriforme TaxID=658196 RepID=A0A397S9Z5_9GLOM|nr:Presenilin-domain-containing protein [Glomus cerebriforme]